MSERLSDERLREVAEFDNGDWIATDMLLSIAEAASMARELITIRSRVVELDAAASNAIGEMLTVRSELTDHQASFDLLWKANMRALARWRAANPGNDLVMPDHADMVVWLLNQFAAGPVMPEVPGDAVIDAACGAGWGDHWIGPDRYLAVYAAIRAALLKEQGR